MSRAIDNGRQWYRLFCVKGLGPKRLHMIYRVLGDSRVTVNELLQTDWPSFQRLLPKLGKPLFEAIQESNSIRMNPDYERLIDKDIKIIHLGHEHYPDILVQRMQYNAPPLLFCKGCLGLLKSDGLAIVGSRDASPKGLALASQFAAELALQGKNVISGYAKGVDTKAHLGALEEDGTTTIVLSSGILGFSRKQVFKDVRWEGNVLVVSQFHPSEKWSGRNAMIRNKLVCALSQAVIVIEAGDEVNDRGQMSGTFDAGKTALQMGIPLFVVDPCVLEAQPRGNGRLIEMGGIEINPRDGITTVLDRLRRIEQAIVTSTHQHEELGQLSMF